MRRVRALVDKSAWLLILPAVLYLFLIDTAMARTLLEWTAYALVLAGITIIISRVTFPQIDLSDFVDKVSKTGDRAAAMVVSAIVIFSGLLMLALVLWARA